ncbi:alpha/beta fold hydrolase [Polymorphobacter fuscus]|uniref:Alpha/beta fold hydrolase n=1 Tax=Sandarakinorhabdus fusca TaxID=1439888 RepID=A0A7C9KLB6_9SPHN|nr:alpha/beta fold hydrolase [Polymorphobacter fuscus]KAB7647763.1 alpha/beta fold hydrolase [Polymorphobacter fuscus]MQT17063.1 alpha/beta fold hydrolase [Polymorphobacter fuscus]NJC08945.1 pimeloyl-ACP methyl ester carboxylesterase [Polymorphobacter fuscus]
MAITTRSIAANGLEFAIDECGDGPDIALCLHGFPESRFSWRHQLPVLAGLGWHAVAPDLRGYGDSSRPLRQSDYHIDHLVADAAALFDALGARRRLLVAHDWGAIIAWIFALRDTRQLDGLVILNVPHPRVFRDVLRASWAQKRKSWYVAFFQLPWLPEALLGARHAEAIGKAFTGMAIDKAAFPPAVIDHYRANASRPGALTAMINYYRANFPDILDEPAPRLAVPTLMLWGEADSALGLELTHGYAPLVSDFTLRRFPNVSHWVQQEAPDAVNAALEEWLAPRRPPA